MRLAKAAHRENADYVTPQLRGQSQRATPPQGRHQRLQLLRSNDYAKPPNYPRHVLIIVVYGPGQRLVLPLRVRARAPWSGRASKHWPCLLVSVELNVPDPWALIHSLEARRVLVRLPLFIYWEGGFGRNVVRSYCAGDGPAKQMLVGQLYRDVPDLCCCNLRRPCPNMIEYSNDTKRS